MENRIPADPPLDADISSHLAAYLIIAVVAAAIYVGCMASPPSLMDDVDSVQAQISRTMLESGDWVTARIDGVAYLEKSPLNYWTIATSFRVLPAERYGDSRRSSRTRSGAAASVTA
jgi:4-amino-4-deoxy-L-arabinose transferase-like glycosyltransferase